MSPAASAFSVADAFIAYNIVVALYASEILFAQANIVSK